MSGGKAACEQCTCSLIAGRLHVPFITTQATLSAISESPRSLVLLSARTGEQRAAGGQYVTLYDHTDTTFHLDSDPGVCFVTVLNRGIRPFTPI